MGGVTSKPAQPVAGASTGTQRRDWKAWFERIASRGSAPAREGKNQEARSPDGRSVRVFAPTEPAAQSRRRMVQADSLSSSSTPSRPSTPRRPALPPLDTGESPAGPSPADSKAVTPVARRSPDRRDGITSASSQLLPIEPSPVREAAEPVVDLSSYTPAQAAEWIEDQASVLDGAAMADDHLEILCADIGTAAKSLSPAHFQAMGQALAKVFNPAPVPSSQSASSSSLSAALAGPAGYAGLKRLMMALLAKPEQAIPPAHAGAFVQGLRLSLPPQLEGADAMFRRTIGEAHRAGTPNDTVIAITCGWLSAMANPAGKASPYTPAQLPAGLKTESLQAAMNIGKRLALNPASVFGPDVTASRDRRFEWLMIAYRMPHPQANERRLPPASRDYAKRVFHLLTPPQKLQLLAAINQTRNLGPLRDMKAEGKAS